MNPQHDRSLAESKESWSLDLGIGLSESEIRALEDLFSSIGGPDLQQSVWKLLQETLREHPELRAGLVRLSAYVRNTRIPQSFAVFLDRDRDALPTLLQILSIESEAAQWLVEDPDSFDWLRMSAGQSVDRSHLLDVLSGEILATDDEALATASLNRFRKRETLRVVCGIMLHDMQVESALQQLAWIADAGVHAALGFALTDRKHRSQGSDGKEATRAVTVLGLGALGGCELDPQGCLDLMFLAETQDSERMPWESIERAVQRAVQMITDQEGACYVLNLPMQVEPTSHRDGLMLEYPRWIQAIEQNGRTWQRMLLMKARSVAGDDALAQQVMNDLPSIVYRRFLNRADIAGIGAVKRKIDRTSRRVDASLGSIANWDLEGLVRFKQEIEFLIQFLQLINGGELEGVRTANTLSAIELLARCRCLTEQESAILHHAYALIRRTLLLRQIQDISPVHAIGDIGSQSKDTERIAISGARETRPLELATEVQSALSDSWQRVSQIRNHLRGEVFVDENQAAEETDLVLDPDPPKQWVHQVLSRWGFTDPQSAYNNLNDLGREDVSMLSTRRCRHFLSTIAPQLLAKIGQTPDPDLTLENLSLSCRSLGAKGVLWELFSVHEPSMNLYVRLCGASSYLLGILTSHPGMIDELLDSLMLNRLPSNQQLSGMLHELCRGADDIEPMVHAFKSAMHLNVGVRDILGKESISRTHRALSDIAEVCLQQIIDDQYRRLVNRYGIPTQDNGNLCRYSILTTGKLGGREPNYHSDLNMLVLYDAAGTTRPVGPMRHHQSIDAELFFHQLAQKVSQTVNRMTRSGRLYELKNWTVVDHQNTTLAWRRDEFEKFFVESSSTALQRQKLCNARVIHGDEDFASEVMHCVRGILSHVPWTTEDTKTILEARLQAESTASPQNLKRGIGGTMDVELLAQWLVLAKASQLEGQWTSGTLETIDRLKQAGVLEPDDAHQLRDGYDFLRSVESGLRLMNTSARHDLPTDTRELGRLAYLLHMESGEQLALKCAEHRRVHRAMRDQYIHLP